MCRVFLEFYFEGILPYVREREEGRKGGRKEGRKEGRNGRKGRGRRYRALSHNMGHQVTEICVFFLRRMRYKK